MVALNDTAKGDLARFTEEMERYKASVAKFKERTESKVFIRQINYLFFLFFTHTFLQMKVQANNLLKAEEEVEALDTCLKQLRVLLSRHEPLFQRVPELNQLYNRLLSLMGAQEQQ